MYIYIYAYIVEAIYIHRYLPTVLSTAAQRPATASRSSRWDSPSWALPSQRCCRSQARPRRWAELKPEKVGFQMDRTSDVYRCKPIVKYPIVYGCLYIQMDIYLTQT